MNCDESDQVLAGKLLVDIMFNLDGSTINNYKLITPGKYQINIEKRELEIDMQIQYTTVLFKKTRMKNGKSIDVLSKKDAIFITFKALNSIEAYLIKKNKMVVLVPCVLKYQYRQTIVKEENNNNDIDQEF